MYAVIENGGKQYRVELGAELEIDRLEADPGARVDIGRVLLIADGDDTLIGTPVVEGARVTAEILRPARGEKLIVFKYRPKARRRVKHGHRQELTVVRVADIEFGGRSAAREAEAASAEQKRERSEATKSAEARAKADAALAEKLADDRKTEATTAKAAEAEPKPARGRSSAKTTDGAAAKTAKATSTTTKATSTTTMAQKTTKTEKKSEAKQPTAKSDAKQPTAKPAATGKATAAKSADTAKSEGDPPSRARTKKEE